MQLYCAFPDSYPIGDDEEAPLVKLLAQGALHKFLDFFNALIFGVEASRNNLVFLTGLLVLSDMRYGSYPSDEEQEGQILYNDLLDLFPMAVTGTGSGNFVAEKAMYPATQQLKVNASILGGHRPVGFSVFRKNPNWLKVSLKSAIVVYNWLGNTGILENATSKPKAPSQSTIEIHDTDDLETTSLKRQRNREILDNFCDNLDQVLYEILAQHY